MTPVIEKMRAFEPIEWELIPNLGLYKDQVITFVEQVYRPLYGEQVNRLLTPSMINNYVKMGVVGRPNGKKYMREELAVLTMLVVLKQASSIEDVARLVKARKDEGIRAVYEAFCGYLRSSLDWYANVLAAKDVNALSLAVGASVSSLACESMLSSVEPAQEEKKK